MPRGVYERSESQIAQIVARNKTAAMRNRPRLFSEEGKARLREVKTVHGHARKRGKRQGTRTYYTWAGMIQRCTNSNHRDWKYYGGRGIEVCERWSDFANFLEDMGEKPDNLSLDRINVNGNYEPGNCRWADALTQSQNRRSTGWESRERNEKGQFV